MNTGVGVGQEKARSHARVVSRLQRLILVWASLSDSGVWNISLLPRVLGQGSV